MSCENMASVLPRARQEGWAVGAFNIIDYASMKAVVQAADALRAPVIVQTSVKTVQLWGCPAIQTWYRDVGERARIPVVLHLDHCRDIGMVRQCVEAGWTSVMIDASALSFEENQRLTNEVVAMARPRGISVEAELGEIGGVEDDISGEDHLVDVEKAIGFCHDTGIDLFAPAIGTAHGMYKGKPNIAFDRLDRIARVTALPIALHGGTGLSDDVFRRCISLGCAKINISTLLKHTWVDSLLGWHADHPDDYEPVRFLAHQLEKLIADVVPLVRLFGGEGRAA